MLTHSEWAWGLSVSPGSSLSQVHLQSNKKMLYTYISFIKAPWKLFLFQEHSLLLKSALHIFIYDSKLQMSILPFLSFSWSHAALTMSLKNPVQRDEIMHIYASVLWASESRCQMYFLDTWREFKPQVLFRAESSVQTKYRHLGNLRIQNPSRILTAKCIKCLLSNKTTKCPWVSTQTLEIQCFIQVTFSLGEKLSVWEI